MDYFRGSWTFLDNGVSKHEKAYEVGFSSIVS